MLASVGMAGMIAAAMQDEIMDLGVKVHRPEPHEEFRNAYTEYALINKAAEKRRRKNEKRAYLLR